MYFMRKIFEVFSIFKKWYKLLEIQSGYLVKKIIIDRGVEYNSNELDKSYEDICLEI